MGIFGGLKWDRKRLTPGNPSEMRMGPNGLVQGGDVTTERLPGYLQGGDEYTGRDLVAQILAGISDVADMQGGGQGGMMDGQMQFRLSAIEMAKKQAEDQLQKQALMEAARQRGINPADVTLAQGGLGGIIPKQGELPERARMAQWYQNASPQERAAFDQTNPIITNGYGSSVVPRNALPGGLDPDRYELIPDDEGGPAPRAPGGFPPRHRR